METYLNEKVLAARSSLRELSSVNTAVKDKFLLEAAKLLDEKRDYVKEENKKDIEFAKSIGLSSAMIDRLKVEDKHINSMIKVLKDVASLKDPVGEITSMWNLPNGLKVGRMRVPLGVILIIYESRPNVTIEASSLCIKSSNAIILRGGKEAINTNLAIVNILKEAAKDYPFIQKAIQFIDNPDRSLVNELLKMEGLIDVVIPRGGESLIKAVAENSKIPVIKHYKGVCNIYIDNEADLKKAYDIVYNAKVQRPSVCNAVENLVIHKDLVSKEFWEKLSFILTKAGVELLCDKESLEPLLKSDRIDKTKLKEVKEEDYYEEFLDLKLSVKTVENLDEAIAFIEKYGSKHSDAIITENYSKAMKFIKEVDSAAVYINASTRFTDGNEFGLGAEMGISTDKIHARGPMALRELTIEKFIIFGEGQLRDNVGIPEDLKKEAGI